MAAADWFASAAVAEPLPSRRRRARPRRAVAPRRGRSAQRRVRGHIVWMTVFALLLAGVVAVNVAVLRANVAVHRLDEQRARLEARNEALASKLSAASSAPRIAAAAHRLGLVEAPAADTSYLDLAPARH
jgi:cell division protein FtsL